MGCFDQQQASSPARPVGRRSSPRPVGVACRLRLPALPPCGGAEPLASSLPVPSPCARARAHVHNVPPAPACRGSPCRSLFPSRPPPLASSVSLSRAWRGSPCRSDGRRGRACARARRTRPFTTHTAAAHLPAPRVHRMSVSQPPRTRGRSWLHPRFHPHTHLAVHPHVPPALPPPPPPSNRGVPQAFDQHWPSAVCRYSGADLLGSVPRGTHELGGVRVRTWGHVGGAGKRRAGRRRGELRIGF
jgi:hypothetical protein